MQALMPDYEYLMEKLKS